MKNFNVLIIAINCNYFNRQSTDIQGIFLILASRNRLPCKNANTDCSRDAIICFHATQPIHRHSG